MILEKVCVENFRSLRNFETDFKKDLSLIVGRNNCGKTSILSIMNKFLNSNSSIFLYCFEYFSKSSFSCFEIF